MKTLFLALALVPLIPTADAEKYSVDNAHSQVVFRVRHLGVSNNYGRFNKISGTFTFDDKDASKSSVEITVDAASVDTDNQKRDDHLRGQDFLSVKEFPNVTFKSTAVKAADKDHFDVTGDFSLHGVKKTITVKAKHIGAGADPWGGFRRGFEIDFTI